MKLRHFITGLLIPLLCASCATPYLWEVADPRDYVVISYDDITREELDAQQISYVAKEDYRVYFIEKSRWRKFGDYTLRSIGTPVTVALDTALVVTVVAAVLYGGRYYDGIEAARVQEEEEREELQKLKNTLKEIQMDESPHAWINPETVTP